jgi:ubiquinone biosynthesis protein Coq4
MLSYQLSNSEMTLQEAINELRLAEGEEIYLPEKLAPEIKEAIEAHDAVHTIFACDISKRDEILAHIFMLLGTTVKMVELKKVAAHLDHRKMTTDAGHFEMIKTAIVALPHLAKASVTALKMKKKFPWNNYNIYLNRKLSDIRSEFGINI